jgi:uncharacterized protein
MRYEWDERKNHENQRKHGVSFELAASVFDDPLCMIAFDRQDETGEQRWHAIGALPLKPGIGAVLVVVHAYREDRDGEEFIRIISARQAHNHDVRRYQEQAVD